MVESRGSDWTKEEVAATVGSYFEMLRSELTGQPLNKAAANELLRQRLSGRSRGAVEFKHQNISAILMENGWLYIDGYKPRKNFQGSLRNEVELRLRRESDLDQLMATASLSKFDPNAASQTAPQVFDPPEVVLGTAAWTPRITGIRRDYVYRDAKNRALGLAGESRVIEIERNRLSLAGREGLASRVEHVAVTQGDGLGYDVLSFEESGLNRYIEVKTTLYSIETPFFASQNEVEASSFYSDQFHLYRLFQFSKKPGMYSLEGSLSESCQLQATNYVAVPSSSN